jgi:hypothetical protein
MQTTRTQSSRSRGQAEPPSPDLSIGRHLGGRYQRGSSESSAAAQSPGESRERRGTGERGGKEVAGRSRPSHWSGSTSWLSADRWAWPDKWARHGSERERWRECF